MRKNQCLDCKDRHVGCHSTCKKYIEFRAQCDKDLEERSKRNKLEAALYDLQDSRYSSSRSIRPQK